MVGFSNTTARAMPDHLFITYGNITVVDLENNSNTYAAHGIPNNLMNPCSNKFKIALTIQRQEVLLLGILRKSTWDMQKSSQLGNL
jgi:hypothetical protein